MRKSALPYVELRGGAARKPVRLDELVAREHKRVVKLTSLVERIRRQLVRARLRYATLTRLAADLAANSVGLLAAPQRPEKKPAARPRAPRPPRPRAGRRTHYADADGRAVCGEPHAALFSLDGDWAAVDCPRCLKSPASTGKPARHPPATHYHPTPDSGPVCGRIHIPHLPERLTSVLAAVTCRNCRRIREPLSTVKTERDPTLPLAGMLT